MQLTRGVRNCNPCNIRRSPDKFRGERLIQRDKDFKQFDSMRWGVRAALCIIRTYINLHHCNTIQKIITRWAPPTENDTATYIRRAASAVGVSKDDCISWSDTRSIDRLVTEMCIIESAYSLPAIVLQSARQSL